MADCRAASADYNEGLYHIYVAADYVIRSRVVQTDLFRLAINSLWCEPPTQIAAEDQVAVLVADEAGELG